MCCIFTCCGWLIDLVQRLWTFTMSCCISSAVCCLLSIGSMSGIALGYNYSLAEYMDLKETNVSIYLKRGVFDDDLTELEWRRAGHVPPRAYDPGAGLKGLEQEADILEAGGTTVRSGRRLDDSVIDLGDQNRYEGSLFKLTAKPPAFDLTSTTLITPATFTDRVAKQYTPGSLDSLKAIQNIIDARKAMAQQYGGSTASPVPTYPFQEAERMYEGMMGGRRGMVNNINDIKPSLSPARYAVPNENIGSRRNWMVPKYPNIPFVTDDTNTVGYSPEPPPTYPPPITLRTGPLRPTTTVPVPSEDNLVLLTRTRYFTLFSTTPSGATFAGVPLPDQNPTIETLKEKLMQENEIPVRKHKPKPEEEYDYDIKGIPVRKRRSIRTNERVQKYPDKANEKDLHALDKYDELLNPISVKDVFVSYDPGVIQVSKQSKLTDSKLNNIEEINVSKHNEALDQVVHKENMPSDLEYKPKTPTINLRRGPRINLLESLISKVKTYFKLGSKVEISAGPKEVNDEIHKDIQNTPNIIDNDFISTEHETHLNDESAVRTEETTHTRYEKTSDNILENMFNDKEINIKSPSSIIVNMLLSTIT